MKAIKWGLGFLFLFITNIVSANISAGVVGRNIHDNPSPAAANGLPPNLIETRNPPGWTRGQKKGWHRNVIKNKPINAQSLTRPHHKPK